MREKTPDCVKCKIPMRLIKGKHGDFFGCRNYPACKYTTDKRFPFHTDYRDLADSVVPGDFNTRKG